MARKKNGKSENKPESIFDLPEVSEEEYDPEPINSLRTKHEDIFSKHNTSTRLARNEELLREQELDSMLHGCLPSKSKKYYFYDPVF